MSVPNINSSNINQPVDQSNGQPVNQPAEQPKIPCMMTIQQASEVVHLPQHYLRRLCKTVPNLAISSGRKYYINMGHLVNFLEGKA